MEIWGAAVDDEPRVPSACGASRRARALIERARERLAAARAYRPPERAQLLELPRRDVQSESLEALRQWSLEEDGPLSCTKYARWRARGSSATGAQHDRAALRQLESGARGRRARRSDCESSAIRPPGGEERRQALAASQRAKVVAAVQRFEREHGRRPAGAASSSGGGSSRWSMHRRRAPCTGCSPAGGPRCFRSRVRRCRRRGRRPRTPARRAGRGSSCRSRPPPAARLGRRRRNRRRRAPVRGRWTGRR